MRSAIWCVPVVALVAFALAGCSTEPKTPEAKQNLQQDAQASLNRFETTDPSMRDLLNRSYGYVVFPSIGKGGAIVGGAYGRGVVYEQGRMIGYADLTQGSVGLQLGGQTYSELVVFETQDKFNDFKTGQFSIGANASAVALATGAAGTARFKEGILIFITKPQGLMGELSVGGQKLNFVAAQPGDTTTPPSRQPSRSNTPDNSVPSGSSDL